MKNLEDNTLMTRVKEGNLSQAGLLYQRHSRPLFGFFYRLTSNRTTSEDLVQNTFVRVIKYRNTFHAEHEFRTWLFQIARNVSKDHFRTNERYSYQNDMSSWEENITDTDNREQQLISLDNKHQLQKAIQTLPREKQEMLLLAKYQKMPYKEIATLYNLTEAAVKTKLHRIMSDLKTTYAKINS